MILARKNGRGWEPDDIPGVVMEVRGSQVRLGIEAPADVPWSDELLAAILLVDLVTTSPAVLAERIIAKARRP
jgi:hypothetical protein